MIGLGFLAVLPVLAAALIGYRAVRKPRLDWPADLADAKVVALAADYLRRHGWQCSILRGQNAALATKGQGQILLIPYGATTPSAPPDLSGGGEADSIIALSRSPLTGPDLLNAAEAGLLALYYKDLAALAALPDASRAQIEAFFASRTEPETPPEALNGWSQSLEQSTWPAAPDGGGNWRTAWSARPANPAPEKPVIIGGAPAPTPYPAPPPTATPAPQAAPVPPATAASPATPQPAAPAAATPPAIEVPEELIGAAPEPSADLSPDPAAAPAEPPAPSPSATPAQTVSETSSAPAPPAATEAGVTEATPGPIPTLVADPVAFPAGHPPNISIIDVTELDLELETELAHFASIDSGAGRPAGDAAAPASPDPFESAADPAEARSAHIRRLLTEGRAALDARRLDEAERFFRGALSVEPQHPPALGGLAAVLSQMGRVDEAITAVQVGLRASPSNAGLMLQLGKLFRKRGDWAEALSCFERALAIQPHSAPIIASLAKAQAKLGQTNEALASVDTALAIDPDIARLHVQRGHLMAAAGRAEEAESSFRRALALDPSQARALTGLLAVLRAQNKAADALALLEEMARARPEDTRIAEQLRRARGEA